MSDKTQLPGRVKRVLDAAISSCKGIIEGLPPSEDSFIPQMLWLKGEQWTFSPVMENSSAAAVQTARVIIKAHAQEIDSYALTYSVYLTKANGLKSPAFIVEVGEQGLAWNYVFLQQFRRAADGKVTLLTDKPICVTQRRRCFEFSLYNIKGTARTFRYPGSSFIATVRP